VDLQPRPAPRSPSSPSPSTPRRETPSSCRLRQRGGHPRRSQPVAAEPRPSVCDWSRSLRRYAVVLAAPELTYFGTTTPCTCRRAPFRVPLDSDESLGTILASTGRARRLRQARSRRSAMARRNPISTSTESYELPHHRSRQLMRYYTPNVASRSVPTTCLPPTPYRSPSRRAAVGRGESFVDDLLNPESWSARLRTPAVLLGSDTAIWRSISWAWLGWHVAAPMS